MGMLSQMLFNKKLKCKKCGQASLVRECDGGDWVFVCRMDGYMIRKCLKCGSLMRIGEVDPNR